MLKLDRAEGVLGTTQLLSEVLPNLSHYSGAIAYVLLQKNKQWTWGNIQREAFLEAKKKLMESEFLTHYDLKKPVILSCDASPYGVGECLSHLMPDGNTQPVAFISRTLSNTERKCTCRSIEKEAWP